MKVTKKTSASELKPNADRDYVVSATVVVRATVTIKANSFAQAGVIAEGLKSEAFVTATEELYEYGPLEVTDITVL